MRRLANVVKGTVALLGRTAFRLGRLGLRLAMGVVRLLGRVLGWAWSRLRSRGKAQGEAAER